MRINISIGGLEHYEVSLIVLVRHTIADFTFDIYSVIPKLQFLSSEPVGLFIRHDATYARTK